MVTAKKGEGKEKEKKKKRKEKRKCKEKEKIKMALSPGFSKAEEEQAHRKGNKQHGAWWL